jgi:EAL domain-containing protein (putative c-di-GMP-specific phosphodiesterase class I)/ActR/RegA family two-component response regulator
VDDEDYVCQYLSLLLGSWGYPVTTTRKFDHVDLAQLAPADVVFIDMMMPGVDGIQVLDALAHNQVKSSIVLMSGTHSEVLTTAETIARRLNLHVAGVLTKPFRGRDLRRILEEQPQSARPARKALPSEINVEDLLDGLGRKEFDAYLQPVLDLASGAVVGCEALARWRSEKFSLVSPDRFIKLAATSGLLPRLTRQIVDRALGYAASLSRQGLPWKISVNLGAEDFVDRSLPEKLAEMVAAHDLPRGALVAELTESSAASNETAMLEVLARMRLKGIELAIDDFGVSYSGLERLSVIPFAQLKIDMRFIADMMTNANARTIVQSSIELARRLKMHSVAEGIETDAQLITLRQMGCDYGQGFLFAPPMEFAEAHAWISERAGAAGRTAGV